MIVFSPLRFMLSDWSDSMYVPLKPLRVRYPSAVTLPSASFTAGVHDQPVPLFSTDLSVTVSCTSSVTAGVIISPVSGSVTASVTTFVTYRVIVSGFGSDGFSPVLPVSPSALALISVMGASVKRSASTSKTLKILLVNRFIFNPSGIFCEIFIK